MPLARRFSAPNRVWTAMLAAVVAALSCGDPSQPHTPGAPPSIVVTIAPSQADVPFGYVATVHVTGDSLGPAIRLLVQRGQFSIPIGGPGSYTYEDSLQTPGADTLHFAVASVSGRMDSTTVVVTGTNTPPHIASMSLSTDSIALGDSALLRIVAVDTRPGFTTRVSFGGTSVTRTAASTADTVSLWARPRGTGTQYAVVDVSDAFGATARDSVALASDLTVTAPAITAAAMRDWIARLADDSLRGRFTIGAEIEKAALAIAARFQQLGLQGAFGGSFIQRYTPVNYQQTAPNVGGLLPGSDSAFRSEVVVIVAHFDAVGRVGLGGRCTAIGADSICNGANDNASGTAAVLELAATLAGAQPRPLRSVLFLAVSGEENGLSGSWYFVNNAPFPIHSVVAALNIDMIGRNAPDSILVAGLDESTLGVRARATAQAHPEHGLRVSPLAATSNSDHWSFMRVHVPALFFYNGSHAEYHKPTDSVDRIDADLAARTARLVYDIALDILNGFDRPRQVAGHAAPPR